MVICDFSDPAAELNEKEIKRLTLQEILEYVGINRGVLSVEQPYPEIVGMVNYLLVLYISMHIVNSNIHTVFNQLVSYHSTSSQPNRRCLRSRRR
jgi:hypothetical protein